jgi:hypothetical protein
VTEDDTHRHLIRSTYEQVRSDLIKFEIIYTNRVSYSGKAPPTFMVYKANREKVFASHHWTQEEYFSEAQKRND